MTGSFRLKRRAADAVRVDPGHHPRDHPARKLRDNGTGANEKTTGGRQAAGRVSLGAQHTIQR
ncbi:hypothetical protein ACFQ3C_03170 [Seohaeicola saemankumensis]|uniref:Uncharacterized protein n=1 Tax=Seohaeicola saemankumensis TaxID=481181 RepID=A0ABW3T9R6_9RHOB